MIVLIAGKSHSGKDTHADLLVEKYNFVKVSIAQRLKEYVNVIYPLIPDTNWVYSQYGKKQFINEYSSTVRDLLIKTSEMSKFKYGDDCWIKLVINDIKTLVSRNKNVVVCDFRFLVEYQVLQNTFKNIPIKTIFIDKQIHTGDYCVASPTETSLDTFSFDKIIKFKNGFVLEMFSEICGFLFFKRKV
jgi:hypothetical protein